MSNSSYSQLFIQLHETNKGTRGKIWIKARRIDVIEDNGKEGSVVITSSTTSFVQETPEEIFDLLDKRKSDSSNE